MKRFSLFLAAGLSLSVLASCSHKERLPENPKDKQVYVDSQGNHWLYNYGLMRWAMSPSGSSGVSHYYYPGTNNWTNTSGAAVTPPSGIRESFYKSSIRPTAGKSGSSSSAVNSTAGKSGSSYSGTSSKPANSGKSFGSRSRGSSFGS